ncbi:coiled-coil domain-containing protein 117 [Candoia aspera]|uniref:coiled-coil domain-containing protein 117 n=1 Tax=Candoia aspera TaxID=51853 RepID=UPI002FD8784D
MASGPLSSAFPPPLSSRPRPRRLAVREGARPPPCAPASSVSPAGASLRGGRKHRMEEEPEGCPPGKKAAAAAWLSCAGAPPGPPEAPCEEMEQAGPEQQCEAARRKLQEIEDRITEEDEEAEEAEGLAGRPEGHLPTLVLSHTLQTGLKQDYEGILTKKIIESMSRPSMELVLWKPLPEFLPEKADSPCIKSYKLLVSERCLGKPAALEAVFPSQTDEFLEEPQHAEMPLAHFGAVGPSGPAEEEMEL